MSVLIGSTFKGLVVGVLCGVLARVGIATGAGLGLLLAYLVAAMPSATGEHYYLHIMLPGFVLGALIGFLTQRWGLQTAPSR